VGLPMLILLVALLTGRAVPADTITTGALYDNGVVWRGNEIWLREEVEVAWESGLRRFVLPEDLLDETVDSEQVKVRGSSRPERCTPEAQPLYDGVDGRSRRLSPSCRPSEPCSKLPRSESEERGRDGGGWEVGEGT
jgi:hypothetical protein